MWNAYKTEGKSLPNKDIRVNNLQVDGELEFSNFQSFDAIVTQESGGTVPATIEVLQIGDIINLYIPELSVNAGSYTQKYKSIPIPLAYRPLSANQSQAIVTRQNDTPGVGSGYFISTSELQLFTRADRDYPVVSKDAITRPTMFSYFKSL